jgi:hypothetical protein
MDAIAWIAEQRIREAARAGLFDNLPGAGQSLSLEDDSHVPEDLRMAYKILRNAGYVPEESAARGDATSLSRLLRACPDLPDAPSLPDEPNAPDAPDAEKQARRVRRLNLVMARIEAARSRPISIPANAYYGRMIRMD